MAVYPNNLTIGPGWLFNNRLYGRPTQSPHWNHQGARQGARVGALLPASSFPDGYGARVPMLALTAGGMAGLGSLTVDGAGSLLSGGPMQGAGTLQLTGDGDLSLVISMSGNGTVTLTGAGGLALTIAMAGDGTVTLTGSGGLSMIVPVSGAGTMTLSGAGDLKGRLALEAGVEDTTLTASAVAQAVWAALSASNDLPGTMGELLATAGSGGLTPTQVAMLTELWRIRGLDPANPVTVTTTQESAGTIVLDISGDGINTSTLTRQP